MIPTNVTRPIANGVIAITTLLLAAAVFVGFLDIVEPGVRPGEVLDATVTAPSGSVSSGSEAPTPGEDPAPAVPVTVPTATTTTTEPPSCRVPTPPAQDGTRLIVVYLPCGHPPYPDPDSRVARRIPSTPLVLTATLQAMLDGPTQREAAAGFRSPFPNASAASLRGVSLADGVATVDLETILDGRDLDNEEGAEILATLNANVFQFDTIRAVEYTIEGDCARFWEPFGSDTCQTIDRSRWNSQAAQWRRLLGPRP